MNDLIWDNTLSVDVEEIDDDHRKLVELFNMLNQAVVDGEAINYIEAVLGELVSCTDWHFKHEERLMLKYGYDDFEAHKSEHEKLIESARAMQEKFRDEGNQVSIHGLEFLERWLTGHILGADMALGLYLGKVM